MAHSFLRRAILSAMDALYPPQCPLCETFVSSRNALCAPCEIEARRLSADANFPSLKRISFSKCRSLFAYDGRVKNAISRFKYGSALHLARFFAAALAEEAARMGSYDLIVPVPLHKNRLGHRGFNQSALVAGMMSKKLAVPCEVDSLQRVRAIVPQVGLERSERIENIRGAFAVKKGRSEKIRGRRILLIDDVATTGATINECAHVLSKALAGSVSVLTIARAL